MSYKDYRNLKIYCFKDGLGLSHTSRLDQFGCNPAERKRIVHTGTVSAYRKGVNPKWARSQRRSWLRQGAGWLAGGV